MDNSGLFTVNSTDDGLHLEGSILWLDSYHKGALSFLSSASHSINPDGPQFIATEETIKIVETFCKKPKALVCQYNRPFSIGRLKMELLPSGAILGGALLHLEYDKKRILYAPHLQTQRTSTARQLQLKKAHVLLLGAHMPVYSMPGRKKEFERLITTIRDFLDQGIYPIIQCQASPTGQELTRLLCENNIRVAVHQMIHKINKVYRSYGSNLGDYSLYSPKHTRNCVLLFPFKVSRRNNLRKPLPDGPILYIENSMDDTKDPDAFRHVAHRFHISTTGDLKDLREVITAVAPKEVYFFGPYAKQYAEELKGSAPSVAPLYRDQQPTLF